MIVNLAISGKLGSTPSDHAVSVAVVGSLRVEAASGDGHGSERPNFDRAVEARRPGIDASVSVLATAPDRRHVGAGARAAVPAIVT